jgi:hypothetical protein
MAFSCRSAGGRVDTARLSIFYSRSHGGPSEAFRRSAKISKTKHMLPRDRVDATQKIALGDPSAD